MPKPTTIFYATMTRDDIVDSFTDDPRKCPFCHTIRNEIPGSSYPYVTIKTCRFRKDNLYYIFPTPTNLKTAILKMQDGAKPQLPLKVKLTNPISVQEKITPTRDKKEEFIIKTDRVKSERQTKRIKGLAILVPNL